METKKSRKPKFSAESIESESSLKKTNQFTYVERATQTYNRYQKDRDIQTEPPKKIEFKANLSQWVIYDKYMAFEESKDKAEEIENRTDNIVTKPRRRRFLDQKEHNSREVTEAIMVRCGKILERMVNQNRFDEIAIGKNGDSSLILLTLLLADYYFYEDVSDEQKQEGTLLPLWTFSHKNAVAMEVTALCWNSRYKDLFAAGFGSCKLKFT